MLLLTAIPLLLAVSTLLTLATAKRMTPRMVPARVVTRR
jgi:hypothetical protein